MTAPKPKLRWHRLTPDRIVMWLLVAECLLGLIGNPVNCILAVGVTLLGLLLWFIASLRYHWQFQYSIRTLLVLTVAVAIPCSWLGVEMRQLKRVREAAAAIRQSGGDVVWWAEYAGDPFNPKILAIYWNCPQVTDTALEQLKCLKGPTELTLKGASITDAGLEILSELKMLEELDISDTQVSDSGLERLKGKRFWSLNLGNTKITDKGLEHIKGMSSLRILDLEGTNVSDQGVKRLQQALPNCRIDR